MAELKVALVEDDSLIRKSLGMLLQGLCVHREFVSLEEFKESAHPQSYDLILLDLCFPDDPTGEKTIEYLPQLQAQFPNTQILIQSGLEDIHSMRACVQRGASQFLLKDHMIDELPLILERCKEKSSLRKKLDHVIIGDSRPMLALKEKLLRYRQDNDDVLIEGETGTGKEICAEFLHRCGPFVAVNVSAIPKDLFESEMFGAVKGAFSGADRSREGYLEKANGGTLFLDEVQSLSLDHQAKLLRVLESRKFYRVGSPAEMNFNGRVVAAANEELREKAARGEFREDLYYRLAPLKIEIPPLRLRSADIQILIAHFLEQLNLEKKTFTDDAVSYLKYEYDWPGNVRELRGFIKKVLVESQIPYIGKEEAQSVLEKREHSSSNAANSQDTSGNFQIDWSLNFDQNVENLERKLILGAVDSFGKESARKALGLKRSRFYQKLNRYQ